MNQDRWRVGLGGKIGLFYLLYNFAVGLKTEKPIVWAPDWRLWKCRKSAEMGDFGVSGPIFKGGVVGYFPPPGTIFVGLYGKVMVLRKY